MRAIPDTYEYHAYAHTLCRSCYIEWHGSHCGTCGMDLELQENLAAQPVKDETALGLVLVALEYYLDAIRRDHGAVSDDSYRTLWKYAEEFAELRGKL